MSTVKGVAEMPISVATFKCPACGKDHMEPTITIDELTFYDSVDPNPKNAGLDGFMVFKLTGIPGRHDDFVSVRFAKGGPKDLGEGRTKELVWGWDGNRQAPTLAPSFLLETDVYPLRVHLHVVKGKIELTPDSEVKKVA